MRDGEHRRFQHAGMAEGRFLQRLAADPLATRLHHVLGSVQQMQRIVRIDRGDVAGFHPAVLGLEFHLRPFEIPAGYPMPAHLQQSRRLAVPRGRRPRLIHDADFVAIQRLALRAHHRQIVPSKRHRRARRRLRHAPPVDGAYAVVAQIRFHHRGGRRGATRKNTVHPAEVQPIGAAIFQYPQPDRRHARPDGDALLDNQPVQERNIGATPWQHQFGPEHRPKERDRPAVAMEKSRHAQDRVVGAQPPAVAAAGRERVQNGPAMAVQRPLRRPGGAGGKAQQRRRAFPEMGPDECGVAGVDQVLVTNDTRQTGRSRHGRTRCHDDVFLD